MNVAKRVILNRSGGGAPPLTPAFRFTINTANTSGGSSTATQFRMPIIPGSTGLTGTMYWGDGDSIALNAASPAGDFLHTYSSSGIYEPYFIGTIRGFQFNDTGDRLKMLNISDWTGFRLSDRAFWGCANLQISATNAPNLTDTSTQFAFRGCTTINNVDMSSWDVSGVIIMSSMFRDCGLLAVNIAGWQMTQVTDMLNFATNSTFTTTNYSNFLIDVSGQGALNTLSTNFGGSKYNAGAVAARDNVISNGWTIIDGGLE